MCRPRNRVRNPGRAALLCGMCFGPQKMRTHVAQLETTVLSHVIV